MSISSRPTVHYDFPLRSLLVIAAVVFAVAAVVGAVIAIVVFVVSRVHA